MCTTRNCSEKISSCYFGCKLPQSCAKCCYPCKYRNCSSIPFVCLFSFVRIFSGFFLFLPLLLFICAFRSPGRENEGEKGSALTLHYLLDMRWGLSYQAGVLSAEFAHYMTLLTLLFASDSNKKSDHCCILQLKCTLGHMWLHIFPNLSWKEKMIFTFCEAVGYN